MSEYTIRRQNGCYLIIGSIPVSEFVALMKTWENMDDEMIVDSRLAHRLGVNFVASSWALRPRRHSWPTKKTRSNTWTT